MSVHEDVASTDGSMTAEPSTLIGSDDLRGSDDAVEDEPTGNRDKASPLSRGVSFRKAMEENRIESHGVRRKARELRPREATVNSGDESEATIQQSDGDTAKVENFHPLSKAFHDDDQRCSLLFVFLSS